VEEQLRTLREDIAVGLSDILAELRTRCNPLPTESHYQVVSKPTSPTSTGTSDTGILDTNLSSLLFALFPACRTEHLYAVAGLQGRRVARHSCSHSGCDRANLSWATACSLLHMSLSPVVCYSKLALVSPVRVAVSKMYNHHLLKTLDRFEALSEFLYCSLASRIHSLSYLYSTCQIKRSGSFLKHIGLQRNQQIIEAEWLDSISLSTKRPSKDD
jgi:hypothetical protein